MTKEFRDLIDKALATSEPAIASAPACKLVCYTLRSLKERDPRDEEVTDILVACMDSLGFVKHYSKTSSLMVLYAFWDDLRDVYAYVYRLDR